jgi:hypothetical protein
MKCGEGDYILKAFELADYECTVGWKRLSTCNGKRVM